MHSKSEISAILWSRFQHGTRMNEYQQSMLRTALEALDFSHAFFMKNTVVARTRGRPLGSQNRSSTRRDPSLFEHVEEKRRNKRKCGHCKDVGQYRFTCPLLAEKVAGIRAISQIESKRNASQQHSCMRVCLEMPLVLSNRHLPFFQTHPITVTITDGGKCKIARIGR